MIRREIFDWLEEAKEELKTSEQLHSLGRYAHSCFHAQQAVEKALKAAILYVKRIVHRSHDLLELYEEVRNVLKFSQTLEEGLPELSAYYTQSRYPNAGLRRPSTEIGKPQAERSLNVARGVIEVVARYITGKV
jgi:HEPN domain-containing protein